MKTKSQETMRKALVERGVPEEEAAISEDDWKARMNEARRKSTKNFDRMREKETAFRDALMAELKIQSELLHKIAEKLGL